MNIANMKRLIDRMVDRKNPVGFDMESLFRDPTMGIFGEFSNRAGVLKAVREHPCRTAACLAGQAAIIAWTEDKHRGRTVWQTARRWLGLTEREASDLFNGHWSPKSLDEITKREAVAKLRRMVAKAESGA